MKLKRLDFTRTTLTLLGTALLLMGACNEQPKKEAEPEENMASQEVEEIETPDDIISLAQADSLFVNYSRRRAENIIKMETEDGSKPFKPVRFISFDLKTVKDYLSYVEQEAKKGGTMVDSLRIYLGNYGDKVEGANKKHNTVFILPSAKADGGYGGIYIGDDGKAKLISNYFHGNDANDGKSKASLVPTFTTNLMQGGGSLILNFGHCCPPQNGDF